MEWLSCRVTCPSQAATPICAKGIYLYRKDVRIRVIRSANPKDPDTIKVRPLGTDRMDTFAVTHVLLED